MVRKLDFYKDPKQRILWMSLSLASWLQAQHTKRNLLWVTLAQLSLFGRFWTLKEKTYFFLSRFTDLNTINELSIKYFLLLIYFVTVVPSVSLHLCSSFHFTTVVTGLTAKFCLPPFVFKLQFPDFAVSFSSRN